MPQLTIKKRGSGERNPNIRHIKRKRTRTISLKIDNESETLKIKRCEDFRMHVLASCMYGKAKRFPFHLCWWPSNISMKQREN